MRWCLTVELRDLEALESSFERRVRRRRVRSAVRRRWVLQGLSLLSAFMVAGFVLLFAGGMAEEQVAVGTVTQPTAAGPPPVPEVKPNFDVEALQGRLEEIVEGRGGVYGVAVLEPDSGTRVSLRGNEEFMAASIGKLPALATLYRAGMRGELDLEEEISILSTDVQDGSGVLRGFPVGHSLSLRECAYRLVNHSDNTAWVMLDRRLGVERIRAELEGMGIKDSWYSGYLSGYYTTPDEVLLLLQKISDPLFTNEELSAEMLDAMTETAFEDRIPEKLPLDVHVAHKTGSYEDNFGDAGVVFYRDRQGVEKRYYLAVLAKGAGEPEARDVIQNVSLAVYEALTGSIVDRGWSRGKTAPVGSGSPPAIWPSPGEPGRQVENAGPTKPLPEGWHDVVPNLLLEPPPLSSPGAWEPADPEAFAPGLQEEPVYQGEMVEY